MLIGIDIGQYSLKVARIKQSARNITANSLTYDVIPVEVREGRDKEALSNMIMTALKKLKIAKGQPVLHVNLGDVILRNIEIEGKLSGSVLENAIELALTPSLPFGIDQVYYDFDTKPNEKGEYTVAAVRRDVADNKVALLKDLPKNFSLAEVDVDAFAFGRLMEYIAKKEGAVAGAAMVIDIGYNRSRFYIYKDGRLIFNREQQIGGKQVNDNIVDNFDISEEVAETRKLTRDFPSDQYEDLVLAPYAHTFVEQLNLVMDFYEASPFGKQSVDVVYLTGGGSRLSGLLEQLRTNSSLNIKLMDLSSYIKLDGSSRGEAVLQSGINHALAIGLAIEA